MQAGLTQLVTFQPDGSRGKLLGELGHITPAVYSYATPGGCDQLTATFQKPPRYRTDALDQGNILRAYRGASKVWEGILDDPDPGADGWAITATGAGNWGDLYRAVYTASWSGTIADTIINAAISRGLDWVNPGIGSPSGLWLGQQPDSASSSITDLLNLICHKGGLTWQVVTDGQANTLRVFTLPTAANRLLVSADPAGQTTADEPDVLYVRYQSAADSGSTPAAYSTTSVTQADLLAQTGRREDYLDLSSAGVQTSGSAQGVGNLVFKRYQRAAYTEPFTVGYGSLQNLGGVRVDPGAPYADGMTAMVCRALLADFTFSGEVTPGPVQFMVGGYEWDDGARQATITPFGALRQDFASLMSLIGETDDPRQLPTAKKRKGKSKGHGKGHHK